MDWRREADILEAILALIVALAGLVDRAAVVPACLQLPVLGFLARGEAVARAFVIALPSGAPAAVAVSRASDRAERLAADLRALARTLRTLLARERLRARLLPRQAGPSPFECVPTRPLERIVPAPTAPDTS
jgi:hypothetical protein